MSVRTLLNQNGFSLVQILVGVGLLSFLAMIFASTSLSQQRQIKHLERKQDVIELRNYATLILQQSDICSCQVNPNLTQDNSNDPQLHFDATAPVASQRIPFSKLRTGCAADSTILVESDTTLNSGLRIRSIELANLRSINSSPTNWLGEWVISFQAGDGEIPLKPIRLVQRLELETAPPSTPNHRFIKSCLGVQGAGVHHVASQSNVIGSGPLGLKDIDLAEYGFEDTLPDPHIMVSMNDGNYDALDGNTVDAYQCRYTKLSKLQFRVECWTSTNTSAMANRSSFDWMALQ
ncbi:type IV pilus modification PilV family protein [Bdellovibrio sp. HCB2-146]|uniref:type IV pilus modification PilV family protein n=1 Tax=Bdellovibrio sp. HCB2-146 TaxID=3394362 RepID=UPI0039BC22B5